MKSRIPRIVVRADASPTMGLGHVKRCLSLCEALLECGADVCLLTRDLGVDVRALAQSAGINVKVLPPLRKADPNMGLPSPMALSDESWLKDAEQSIDFLQGTASGTVIVDHYGIDARWHRLVAERAGVTVAVIDDIADRPLDCDILIDHNYADDHALKYQSCCCRKTKILGGPRFALLSSVYAGATPYEFRREVESIGIFMGGTDWADYSAIALQGCRKIAGFTGPIEIVTTRANPNLARLESLCADLPPTRLRLDLPNLADFFSRHDLQIGAGGGATWERCRVGAPTLAIACADNQRSTIESLSSQGIIATIGIDSREIETQIGVAVERLIADDSFRLSLSLKSRNIVDGLGAKRVALALCAESLSLRDAVPTDAELLYRWRNHPATRAVSLSQDEIEWSSHRAWFHRVLCDRNRLLLIGMIGSVPVGVIRFDGLLDVSAEVSLYLDPSLHGLGLGSRLLFTGERRAVQSSTGLRGFVARVVESNRASRRLFEAAGYRPASYENTFIKNL